MAAERTLIRILHVVLSIPILGYIYGPVASIPQAARFTRWIAMPIVVFTGFWLWLKPRLLKRLRSHQRVGARRVILCAAAMSLLASSVATAQSVQLTVGDPFPYFSGQTVTGKPLELPKMATGKIALVIFTFGRVSGKDGQAWNLHLAKDFQSPVLNYTIIVAESVPQMFRGRALSGIKSGMPQEMQDRAVLLFRDEQRWRRTLGVTDDHRAYVLLLGQNGRVVWKNATAFSESDYAFVKSRLAGN